VAASIQLAVISFDILEFEGSPVRIAPSVICGDGNAEWDEPHLAPHPHLKDCPIGIELIHFFVGS
jgi:hypothetical protein